ncbi:MAG: sensory transduction histidine kinase [Proteobacteria bacterium]|nr:sensory transduction histidine kinase [Pseudomonadota bacterium]
MAKPKRVEANTGETTRHKWTETEPPAAKDHCESLNCVTEVPHSPPGSKEVAQRAAGGDAAFINPAWIMGNEVGIGEPKAVQDRLRAPEAKYRIVAENTYDWEFWIDADGRFLYCSPSCERVTGHSETEFLADPGLRRRLIHPEDLALFDEHILKVEQGRAFGEAEWRDGCTDGTWRWMAHACQPVWDEHGSYLGVRASNRDITERKNVEEALRTLNETLEQRVAERTAEVAVAGAYNRSLIEASLDPLVTIGSDGRITDVNVATETATGVPRERLIGTDFSAYFTEPEKARMGYMQVFAEGHVSDYPLTIRHKDGSLMDVLYNASVYKDASGKVVGIFAAARDITKRKLAEAALRRISAYNRSLIEASLDPLVTIGSDGKITDVNVATETATGRPRAELVGTDFSDYFTDPEKAREGYRRAFREGLVRDYPLEIRHHDGRVTPVLYNATVYREQEGQATGVFAAARDMTERLRYERILAERNAEVQRLAEQLRALASDLSQTEQRERRRLATALHDNIQQLLVSAQMQLSLIKRQHPEVIQSTAQGVASILAEALDASRSLTVELCPPVLHQSGLASALTWLAARMREQQQFRLHLRTSNYAEPSNPDDRAFLFEAVRELLLNAVKHSGVREAHLAMIRTKDEQCRIIVEDKGSGFDTANIRPGPSSGFGLFAIQQRLLYMGGTLEIESTPGRGTRAVLSIPIGHAETPEAVLVTASPTDATGRVTIRPKDQRIRVILVDDHKIMRQGLSSLLQFENDIEIIAEAENGQRALELARENRPDVVVMDVNMPVMNGIDATRILMKEMPYTKVIALSMHMDGEAANAMREAGAVAYLTKGGPSEDLVEAIRACCRHQVAEP